MKPVILALLPIYLLLHFVSHQKKSEYTLEVNEKQIIESRNKYLIPVTLRNISDETLYHYEMSCSFHEHYSTSNKDLKIEINVCDKNFPKVMSLKPHGSQICYLQITPVSGKLPKGKVKIGFNLIASASKEMGDYDKLRLAYAKNILWSNAFIIKPRHKK